jgi:hypothetical protein
MAIVTSTVSTTAPLILSILFFVLNCLFHCSLFSYHFSFYFPKENVFPFDDVVEAA